MQHSQLMNDYIGWSATVSLVGLIGFAILFFLIEITRKK